MQKILMRAAMSPFYNPDFIELSTKNLIGDNVGNLLFARSVCRTIMTDDTQVDFIKTDHKFSEKETSEINNEYDYFVIPLANAFRLSFMRELNQLSGLIENLDIPCVVIGVGIQDTLTNDTVDKFPFDEDVKRFINCVLEKSTMIGLRGEHTAKYLEYLGYTPEKDFTVIGCPSMYLYGGKLPEFQKKELTPDSAISVNCKIKIDPKLHAFMKRNLSLLHNYHYVPQILDEMNAMYLGKPLAKDKYPHIPDYYPSSFASPIYTEGHGIGFLNASTWLEYLSQQDLSFGSRIHGNIAAIVSGTPCYIIASDARVQELAEYHYIPHTPFNKLPENATIFDLYEQADYGPMFSHQLENFHHYLDFLNANQVPHIYKDSDYVENSPFDKKIKEIDFHGPIRAFSDVTPEEQAQRLKEYDDYMDEQKEELQTDIKDLKNTINDQKKEISSLKKLSDAQQKELNHKSIQLAVKIRRKVEQTGIIKKLKGQS